MDRGMQRDLPPDRMAASDALFWYAEAALPVFRPIIAGLYVLRRSASAEAFRSTIESAVASVARLRQRVVGAPLELGMPEWVEDEHFDLEYHLRHLSVGPPGTMRELLDLAAALLATPLDRERPLWEAYRIDGIEGDRSALFLKMHHAMVDGVGSIAILDALTGMNEPHAFTSRARRRSDVAARLVRAATGSARTAVDLGIGAARLPLSFVRHPIDTLSQAAAVVRGLTGVIADARKPLIDDPLAHDCGGLSRRLDTTALYLDQLRAIKRPWGATINDVVLTALTGALRAYYLERRVRVAALNCLVPMNLRGKAEKDALGNRVGLCTVSLPMAQPGVEERLSLIVAQTRAAKRDMRGALYPILVEALTVLPGAVFGWLAHQALGRVNVACTNVPGVEDTRRLAGIEIEAIYPFASVVEKTPLVMALVSYAGRLHIGLDTDPEAIPDPHRIVTLFEAAIDELEAARPSKRAA